MSVEEDRSSTGSGVICQPRGPILLSSAFAQFSLAVSCCRLARCCCCCCCCCQNNLSVTEATHFLGEFHRIFPTIRIAMDALTKKVAQDGYVKTLFERRRSVLPCGPACAILPSLWMRSGLGGRALRSHSLFISTLRCDCLLLCVQHPPRCEWQRAVPCGRVPKGSQHSVPGQRC